MSTSSWSKRGLALLLAYLLYLWSWQTAFAEEARKAPTLISLQGHLGKEELQAAAQLLEQANFESILAITLNSTSGELLEALELAKKIYQLKIEKKVSIVVYLEENAIGPAAIFPFLADQFLISSFVAWGDIPQGNEKVLTTNVLRNSVTSLINPQQPHAALLQLIAAAMCDPSIRLVEEKGNWRLADEEEEGVAFYLNTKGETLVVNHYQLQNLGIVNHGISPSQFFEQHHIKNSESLPDPSAKEERREEAISTQVLEKLKKHIWFNQKGPNLIGHIIINDRTAGINQSTWLYVKQALETYKELKPIFIILELNTPGGEVFAAQKISDALKNFDTQFSIPIVAYINNWAISAGAMLAYSCRFIVAAQDASMGAAEPIIQDTTTGKTETASEKVNSALRADFANRARFFGRNPLLAEAMVDKDLLLVKRHGKIIKLDSDSQIRAVGPDPDEVISPKGKLLTLDAQQLMSYGVADMLIPPTKIDAITTEEQTQGKWPASKMALFHQPFFDQIPGAIVESYQMDWKTRFFALLASPIVSSMLFLGLLLGFYLEASTPGFGVPGTIAAICLFLIILSSFSLEIANWLELIMLLVGLGIILVELFILPTFGLLGAFGIVFFLVGLFGMMLPGIGAIDFEFDTKTLNAAGQVFVERLAWLSGTLIFAFISILLLGRFVTPQLAGFSRFVLKGNEQEGYLAGGNPADFPVPGTLGEAVTTLRPAGKITIGDTLYEAISTGSLIEKSTPVVVVRVEGNSLIVTAATESKEEPHS